MGVKLENMADLKKDAAAKQNPAIQENKSALSTKLPDAERNFFLANSEGYLAVVGNILLGLFKLYVGFVTSSIAIVADAWHTLSDSFSSVVLLVGVRIARKPPDEEHPFGHGRAELLAALFIGTMLAGIALEFMMQGISSLRHHEAAQFGYIGIIAMIVSIVVKELMAQYAFWVARKTKMSSLAADAQHHRSDALSSLVLLGGILFGEKYWFMDGALSIVVALFIFYTAFGVLRNCCNQLLGVEPEAELLEYLRSLGAELGQEAIEVHHVHEHRYGTHTELTFHIRLSGDLDLRTAHEITRKMEQRLAAERHVLATIHVEPLREKKTCC